jgi:hypothetical protein
MKKDLKRAMNSPKFRKHLERVELVEKMMLEGFREAEIASLAANEWKEEPAYARKLIAKVLDGWSVRGRSRSREEKRDLMRAQLEYGWKRSLHAGEMPAAVNFQKSLAKLDDLNNEGRALDGTLAGVNTGDRMALERRLKELVGRQGGGVALEALRLPDSVRAEFSEVRERGSENEREREVASGVTDVASRETRDGDASESLRSRKAPDVHPDGLTDIQRAKAPGGSD